MWREGQPIDGAWDAVVAMVQDDLGHSPWSGSLPFPSAPVPTHTDVAVVGAGLTGLSAALEMATRGIEVAVFDRSVGGGATTRSGGIVLGETLVGPDAAFQGCEQTLRAWIDREGIACDAVWSGCLELTRLGTVPFSPTGLVDGGPLYNAGCVAGGMLDPSKLLSGLITAVLRAGVRIVRAFDVNGLETTKGMPAIIGSGRVVTARHVLMAVDAVSWRHRFDPWANRAVTLALQTDAEPALGHEVGIDRPFYTCEIPLLWGRPLPDGSLLFGREFIAWPLPIDRQDRLAAVEAGADRLIGRVRCLHPRLDTIGIRRVWGGTTARTLRGLPTLTSDPEINQVTWAGGYGGHGLAQAFVLGRSAAWRIARALASGATRIRTSTRPG